MYIKGQDPLLGLLCMAGKGGGVSCVLMGRPVSSPFTPPPEGNQSMNVINNKSMQRRCVVTDILGQQAPGWDRLTTAGERDLLRPVRGR